MPPRPVKPEQRLTAADAPPGATSEEARPFTADQPSAHAGAVARSEMSVSGRQINGVEPT